MLTNKLDYNASFHRESGECCAIDYDADDTDSVEFNQDSSIAIRKLFNVAVARLKPTGRLAFWLPTDANITQSDVRNILRFHERKAGINNNTLVFERTKQQEVNTGVWRWLCVYSRTTEVSSL